jgi:DUF4097 and DUF4098 domain-containing protein YvlB
VRARSVSGEVQLTDVAGDADGESVSGDVGIHGAHSKVARAETFSGDVEIRRVGDKAKGARGTVRDRDQDQDDDEPRD